ncbi:SAV_915 family protein [Saccharopolyspora dendranthemae]|uniref:SAV_915 family protein n=1 Tax=Saccharopolyspora dendranthemae TaxID=1181886 RepID=UPI002482EB80|nr:SAV_915 family protein [Saccharopolyspora dendranthemae]
MGEADDDTAVFLPAEPVAAGDRQARLELRHTTGGQLALLVYTSLERLVKACGDQQPWISVPVAELHSIAEQVEAEVVLEDIALPDVERRD